MSSAEHRAELVAAARRLGGLDLLAKAAGDLMSAVLAVEEPALRVWWVDPGSMGTRMVAAAGPAGDLAGLPTPQEVAPLLLRLVTEALPSGRYTARGLSVPDVA